MHDRKGSAEPPATPLSHCPEWLTSWIKSVRAKYAMPEAHNEVLDKILAQIRDEPETVIALEVGRLVNFFERHGMVTDKTPLADKAVQALIEAGRSGPIDQLTGELRSWFRKRYLWATSTLSMDVRTILGDDAEKIMGRYFKDPAEGKPRK
jgi:hypothetical protein